MSFNSFKVSSAINHAQVLQLVGEFPETLDMDSFVLRSKWLVGFRILNGGSAAGETHTVQTDYLFT